MKILIIIILLLPFSLMAQVGVNTTTPNAMLDIVSTENGVLIPRIQLTSILDNTTIVNPNSGPLVTSTLVYNMAAAGTAPNNVVAGFYYWNGSQWIAIAGSAISDHDWYGVGTTTAPSAISDSMFHTGKVAIGTATPFTVAALQVDLGTSNTDGVIFSGTNSIGATVPNLGSGTRMMFFPGKNAFRVGTVTGTEWDNTNVGINSVAMGRNTIASGDNATAFGRSYSTGINSTSLGLSIASGTNSTAMGTATANGNGSTATGFSTANGENSISGGTGSSAGGESSFAMGSGSQANGLNSVAMGNSSTATGEHAIAMGNSVATASYSTAINTSIANAELSTSMGIATANGYGSLATGFSTTHGNYAISGGSGSVASGNHSLASGNSTEASGLNAVAFGNHSVASGNNSVAIGSSLASGQNAASLNGAIANGENTTAVGESTANGNQSLSSGFSTANGQYSFSSGFGTTTQSIGETSMGFYNRLYTMSASGETTFDANDHLFNLGNGTSAAATHNALTIYKDGRLNINEEYTLPNADGTANQILQTDGSGTVTWANPADTKVVVKIKPSADIVNVPGPAETPLIFNVPVFNFGGGTLDPTTGSYTIPYNGVYNFLTNINWSYNAGGSSYIICRFRIYVNGVRQTNLGHQQRVDYPGYYENFHYQTALNLNQNDVVTFRIQALTTITGFGTPFVDNLDSNITIIKIY